MSYAKLKNFCTKILLKAFFKESVLSQEYRGCNNLKLHLGCGGVILDGWVNIDKVPCGNEVVVMELPAGLKKFKNDSARFIYLSHLLEHLEYRTEALDLVRECHRILIPKGTLRIIVPGIERIIRAYVSNDENFFKVQKQMHPLWCTTKLEHLMYALQQNGEHKYGYDFETISKLLLQAGFEEIINSDYNQSRTEELRLDYRGENLSLFIEAIKG